MVKILLVHSSLHQIFQILLENGNQTSLIVRFKQGLKLPIGPKAMSSEQQRAVRLKVSDPWVPTRYFTIFLLCVCPNQC